jgi:hypothetical protein
MMGGMVEAMREQVRVNIREGKRELDEYRPTKKMVLPTWLPIGEM